jgi:G10 protein
LRTWAHFARMAAWKRSAPPAGYEVIENAISALDRAMRECACGPGDRDARREVNGVVGRVERGFGRCAAVAESHEGKRKVESQWPVHQINNQRTYVAPKLRSLL